jgi:hypothetical protein
MKRLSCTKKIPYDTEVSGEAQQYKCAAFASSNVAISSPEETESLVQGNVYLSTNLLRLDPQTF